MNIDVKIKHFRETSLQEARALAEEQTEAHQQRMAQMEVEHKQEKKRLTEETLRKETERAKRELSRTISASSLQFRHLLSGKQQELKDQLFAEVHSRLDAFRSTPDYETHLLKKIREAIAFAGEDHLLIYLSPEDAALLSSLREKSGFPLELSETSFGGGMLAVIPEKNIQINNTFRDSLQSVSKEFTFDGGASI